MSTRTAAAPPPAPPITTSSITTTSSSSTSTGRYSFHATRRLGRISSTSHRRRIVVAWAFLVFGGTNTTPAVTPFRLVATNKGYHANALCGLRATTTPTRMTVVQVCQNKDCCRRFQSLSSSLVQVLQDLTNTTTTATTTTAERSTTTTSPSSSPSSSVIGVRIEATGCRSQCDLGPNVQINHDQIISGILSPLHAVALLQGAADGSLTFAPSFINAVMALEKAQAGECVIWGCILSWYELARLRVRFYSNCSTYHIIGCTN